LPRPNLSSTFSAVQNNFLLLYTYHAEQIEIPVCIKRRSAEFRVRIILNMAMLAKCLAEIICEQFALRRHKSLSKVSESFSSAQQLFFGGGCFNLAANHFAISPSGLLHLKDDSQIVLLPWAPSRTSHTSRFAYCYRALDTQNYALAADLFPMPWDVITQKYNEPCHNSTSLKQKSAVLVLQN